MRVLNIHERVIAQPKSKILELFNTISSKDDRIWPREKWPAIKFKAGLIKDAVGGHGPIRYSINSYDEAGSIEFQFNSPKGFDGIHRFDITELSLDKTLIKHTIRMETNGFSTLLWLAGIRTLHDALTEDAFDKVENQFLPIPIRSKWNPWVRFLRLVLK